MPRLILREAFLKTLEKLDKKDRRQVKKKVLSLEQNIYIGKKLSASQFWPLRIGKFRVIYDIIERESIVEVIDILKRKHDYRELGKLERK